MPGIWIRFDPSKWTAAIARLGSEKADKAIERGLNRTGANAKTAVVKAVADDLGLQQKAIRDRIILGKASARAKRLAVRIYASRQRIPLVDFKASGPDPSRGRGHGITARLPTGRQRYPDAFFARVSGSGGGSHRGVFRRKVGINRHGPKPTRSQLPIYELRGPSPAHAFEKHSSVVEARALEMLEKNLAHEFNFLITQQA